MLDTFRITMVTHWHIKDRSKAQCNDIDTCPFCWTSGGLETDVDGMAGAGDASLVTLCVSPAAVSASYCLTHTHTHTHTPSNTVQLILSTRLQLACSVNSTVTLGY